MSKKYTLLTFKGICMNFLLKLKFFILGHPVTSKQPYKIVQILLVHPVGANNYHISESSNVQVKERVKHRVRFCRKALHNESKLILNSTQTFIYLPFYERFCFIFTCNLIIVCVFQKYSSIEI